MGCKSLEKGVSDNRDSLSRLEVCLLVSVHGAVSSSLSVHGFLVCIISRVWQCECMHGCYSDKETPRR